MSAADFTDMAEQANDEAMRSMESLLAIFTIGAINAAIWGYVAMLVLR